MEQNLIKHGEYLRITNAFGHPLSDAKGNIPYHRFVLYEKLGQPDATKCHWCGYILCWKTGLSEAYLYVVNADHLDSNKSNNDPSNLVPTCWWCNSNRSWAEAFPEFWSNWRRWMKDVPPAVRPKLAVIASEQGFGPFAEPKE